MTKILIVDDSSFQRRTIRRALAQEGYEILEGGDGEQALHMAESEPLDCILMDLIMPGVDGLSVLQSMRVRHSQTPVIVITADIQNATRQQCLELGARDFIHKPIDGEEVRLAVRRALDIRQETGQ